MTPSQRNEVERAVAMAVMKFGQELKGKYYSLRGSASYTPMPKGMSEEVEKRLGDARLLFSEPDSAMLAAAGAVPDTAQDWPNGRGVFATEDDKVAIWINRHDHVCVVVRETAQPKAAYSRALEVLTLLEEQLYAQGHHFDYHPRLGYLTSACSLVGTLMRGSVTLPLKNLGADEGSLKKLTEDMLLQARQVGDSWELGTVPELGTSEVDQVNALIEGVARATAIDAAMGEGKSFEEASS
mmetsp:Transcript_55237/g.118544  ORF Transcript_55237/g.118544 Transcript_55237/m.118544 type:complete len:240 (-) Transcript_55237:117-836(-)